MPSVLADEETPPHIWHRDTLTGDWGGLRKELADKGVVFTMTYTGEVWGNVKGGIKQGATYDGQLLPQADVDLDKLMGWKGASFRASMLQGHGPALSVGWVGNLLGASSIVAVPPATRLYNLWLQQNLFDDLLSVRVGVMNIDAEFFTSVTASLLMNTTFGWPGWLGVDLPGGGPAYPLSDPGVRIRLNPGPAGVYAQAAVFSGDPTGHGGENTGLGLPVGYYAGDHRGSFDHCRGGLRHQSGQGRGRVATRIQARGLDRYRAHASKTSSSQAMACHWQIPVQRHAAQPYR